MMSGAAMLRVAPRAADTHRKVEVTYEQHEGGEVVALR